MAYGYWNRILRVNLTDRTSRVDEPDDAFYRRYMGGRGFIGYYLLTETPGVSIPGRRRTCWSSRRAWSPPRRSRRRTPQRRSEVAAERRVRRGQAGGYWGAELKKAGYDALIVEGQATEPTWLWITSEGVEFRDARRSGDAPRAKDSPTSATSLAINWCVLRRSARPARISSATPAS